MITFTAVSSWIRRLSLRFGISGKMENGCPISKIPGSFEIKLEQHYDSAFYSKVILEHLIKSTDAFRWPKLYDLLCDLKIVERMLEDGHRVLYWACDGEGWTDLRAYHDPYRDSIRIAINDKVVRFERRDKRVE